MPTTPRRSNGAHQSPETLVSQKKRLNRGLWKDGKWWCNCEPRNEAIIREAKKKGPNKGRLFWTCKSYPFCNFFLWYDQAKAREGGNTSSSAVETPESTRHKAPVFTQHPLTSFGVQVTPSRRRSDPEVPSDVDSKEVEPADLELTDSDEETASQLAPPAPGTETPCPGPSKRKRDAFEDDEDDEFSDFNSDEEREMAVIADNSAKKPAVLMSKSAPVTPSNVRTHDVVGGLPTPSVVRTLFPGSEAKRQKRVMFEDTPSSTTLSATVTPSTVGGQPPSSSPNDASYDATDEVMTLLHGQNVDPSVLVEVRSVLTTAARRTKGIALGRDSARASLKVKDDRISMLQERIAALENKERMHQRQVTNIKANLMKMYEDN